MTKVSPWQAGLLCRCPNCGQAALFDGYLKVRERCGACGEDFTAADSGDGPVVFILLIVGAIGCFGLLLVEFNFHPPIWLQLLIWLPLVGLLALGALRPFKALMIALQFQNHACEVRGDDASV